jgi:hypothetical protein
LTFTIGLPFDTDLIGIKEINGTALYGAVGMLSWVVTFLDYQ